MVKKPDTQQTAFKEAMELIWSSSMSWEDQVQKEEEWKRHDSNMKGSHDSGLALSIIRV